MARKRIDKSALCKIEFTYRDGHKELSHWSKPYTECKKLISTYKRQDKHGLVGDVNMRYRVVKAR